MWQLADQLRDGDEHRGHHAIAPRPPGRDVDPPRPEWQRCWNADAHDLDATLRAAVHALFPFAEERHAARQRFLTRPVARAIATLSSLGLLGSAPWQMLFLEQAAKTLGHRGGEFLSPASVRQARGRHRRADRDRLQPCHRGRAADDRRRDYATSQAVTSFVGQEINRRIWAMAQLNLAIHVYIARRRLG